MGKQVSTYPPEEDRERWKKRAEEMDMTLSQFIQSMVEAGIKKFDRTAVEPDSTKAELRKQRADLQQELEQTRDRVEELENQLYRGERKAVVEYVKENPGAEYGDILQHVTNTASGRVTSLLDSLEGEHIEMTDGGYYVMGEVSE